MADRRISILRWCAVCAWMALIFIGSSVPGSYLPEGSSYLSIFAHFFEYFVLTILFISALNKGFRPAVSLAILAVALLLSSVYGLTDELHQTLIEDRYPDPLDLLVDVVGSATAAALVLVYSLFLKMKRNVK